MTHWELERIAILPGLAGDNWVLSTPTTVWGDLNTSFPNGCTGCPASADNATGIEWSVPGLAAGESQSFPWTTVINDTVPTGGRLNGSSRVKSS